MTGRTPMASIVADAPARELDRAAIELRLSWVKRSSSAFWMMIDRLIVTRSGGRSSPRVKFNSPRWSA